MTRSRKVEQAIKENDKDFSVIGIDYDGHDVTEFTNEGADSFCPFIDNKRAAKVILAAHGIGTVHRDYPARLPCDTDIDTMNQLNRKYHWVQINFTSVQYCKYQRDPEAKYEKCECDYKNCSVYKNHI